MYKLLICPSPLAIRLNVLPIAEARDNAHHFGDTTKVVIRRSISGPVTGVSLTTDITRTHTEMAGTELTLGRSLLLIATNRRTRAFAVHLS
jgi:hypothetical protein